MGFIRVIAMAAAVIACSVASGAGSLRVAPTRLDLPPEIRAVAMTVTNTGSAPVLLQLQASRWSQAAGTDDYTATDDIIVSPPIFTLDPGADQVVRVGRREQEAIADERPYRLFIQEVPTADRPRSRELSVVLRIGVPLFVTPKTASEADLAWDLECREGTRPVLRALNRGGRALRLDELTVRAGDTEHIERAVYVLAGAMRLLAIPDAPLSAKRVDLDAWSGQRELRGSAVCR